MEKSNEVKIEVGYGSAQEADPFLCGKKAAGEAVAMIPSMPVAAVIVFASVQFDLGEVLRGIKEVVPDAPRFGCTTACEICNSTLHHTVTVLILATWYLKVSCGVGNKVSANWQLAVDAVVNTPQISPYFNDNSYWTELTLKGKSVFGILFSPGNTRDRDSRSYHILEAIKQKTLGRLPVFGGATADDWKMEANYVLNGEEAFQDGMLLAVFETQLSFGIAMDHGFVPTGQTTTVTRVHDQEVLEFDGKTAAEVYADWVCVPRATLEGKHLTMTTRHAMGVSDSMGQYSINVASYITSAGGIRLTQPVTPGTVLTLMKCDDPRAPTAGQEALKKAMMRGGIGNPAVALVAYCALRPQLLGQQSEQEIQGMRQMLAPTPLIGFCSFGEQGVADDGTARHNNGVISVLVLGNSLSPNASVAIENEKLQVRLEQQSQELCRSNEHLKAKIVEGARIETELKEARVQLERRVLDRTKELSQANEQLKVEIAERKQTEEQLRESTLRFQTLADATFEGVAISEQGRFIDVNSPLCQILGYERSELIGMEVAATIPPEDRALVMPNILTDTESRFDHEMLRKDGSRRFVEAHGQSITRHGQGLRITAIRDVTEGREIEQARKTERELLQKVFDTIPVMLTMYSPSHQEFSINREFERVVGFSSEEIKHVDVMKVCYPDPSYRQKAAEFMASLSHTWEDFHLRTREGQTVETTWTNLVLSDNTHIGVGIDISHRTKIEKSLRESEELFRTLCNSAPIGIFRADCLGGITYVNPNCEAIGGAPAEEFLGHGWMRLMVDEDREAKVKIWLDAVASRISCAQEYLLVTPQGKKVLIQTQASPIIDESGNCLGYVGIVQDITELRQALQEMTRTQKLESLGVLAGGIAHDFNNILTAVLGNISLAKVQLAQPDQLAERLLQAENAAVRAKDLTQQLLTFARGGEPVKRLVQVDKIVRESAIFASHGSTVKCQILLQDKLWPVEADEGQLSQVVNNLVINAIQAMPEGGTVAVGAENDGSRLEGRRAVKIFVSDTGTGIQEQDVHRVFDPYFTTKREGTGLGLATCFSIVKKHEGLITFETHPGKGTTFYVYLPAAEGAEVIPPQHETGVQQGKERILVMDDEDIVCDIAAAMLGQLGYYAECAKNGAEAIELYAKRRQEGTPFSGVIMDLTIPGGMGGKDAIKLLLQMDPDVKAIVSSGYSTDPVMANHRDYGFVSILKKPYLLQDLSTVLKESLRREK